MIKITVEGPGSTLWGVTTLIQQMLERFGAEVEVRDEHPPARKPEQIKDYELYEYFSSGKKPIILETKHIPWGG